jgi:hypothetical protein
MDMSWPLAGVAQPFPIPTAFFMNVDTPFNNQSRVGIVDDRTNRPASASSASSRNKKAKPFKPALRLPNNMVTKSKQSGNGKVVPVVGFPDFGGGNMEVEIVVGARPQSAPGTNGTNNGMGSPSPEKAKKEAERALYVASLLSPDRPTVILTTIFERIAKKERDAALDVHGHVEKQKYDIFHNLLINPAFSMHMPIPVPRLTSQNDDWLESNVLLESLVDEDDTVHMELTILFRAVCDSERTADKQNNSSTKAKASADSQNKVLETHFLNALRLLKRLHEDLRCPTSAHTKFWQAHNIIHPATLVAILSRLCHLNKCRNFLIDIFRLAAKLSTFKENGFMNFTHFPAPKRPIKTMTDTGRRKSVFRGRSQATQPVQIVAPSVGSTAGGVAAATAVPATPSRMSAFFGQAPSAIRETARKSVRIQSELSNPSTFNNRGGMNAGDNAGSSGSFSSRANSFSTPTNNSYQRWSLLSRFSNVSINNSNSNSNNFMLKAAIKPSEMALDDIDDDEDEYDEDEEEIDDYYEDDDDKKRDEDEDNDAYEMEDSFGNNNNKNNNSDNINNRRVVRNTLRFSTHSSLRGTMRSTMRSTTRSSMRSTGGGMNSSRSTMMSTGSNAPHTGHTHTQMRQLTSINPVGGGQMKFNKAAEEQVLRTWIKEWSTTLPWKVCICIWTQLSLSVLKCLMDLFLACAG